MSWTKQYTHAPNRDTPTKWAVSSLAARDENCMLRSPLHEKYPPCAQDESNVNIPHVKCTAFIRHLRLNRQKAALKYTTHTKSSLPSSVIWWLRSISFPKALRIFYLHLHSMRGEKTGSEKKIHISLGKHDFFWVICLDIFVHLSSLTISNSASFLKVE